MTAFLLPASSPDHDVWVRFFTPTMEVPVCGCATIAAHYIRARELGLTKGKVHVRRTFAFAIAAYKLGDKISSKIQRKLTKPKLGRADEILALLTLPDPRFP